MTKAVRIGFLIACLAACGNKHDKGAGAGAAGSVATTAAGGTCPPGQAMSAGACVKGISLVERDAVGAVKVQLDGVAGMLDRTQAVQSTVDLLDQIRQLPAWKTIAATNDKLASVGDFVGALADGVKQLRAFQASLKDASAHMGNALVSLDLVLKSTGAGQQLDDLRVKFSAEVSAAVTALQSQLIATIQKVLVPLKPRLDDVSDLVLGACAMAKLSGGGDQLHDLCAKAKTMFGLSTTLFDDLSTQPTLLLGTLHDKLEGKLGALLDPQTKATIDSALAAIEQALKTPVPGSAAAAAAGSGNGSGSGSSSGSGSATL